MATLKLLKGRIQSIKSTQKITSAMKLVASAHLKKAEARLGAAARYTAHLQRMLDTVSRLPDVDADGGSYLKTKKTASYHLLFLVSGNRGLCGGYNINLGRKANQILDSLIKEGKTPHIVAFGSKALVGLHARYHELVDHHFLYKEYTTPKDLHIILSQVLTKKQTEGLQTCSILYTSFQTVMTSIIVHHPLIPLGVNILKHSRPYKSLLNVQEEQPLFDTEPKGQLLIDLLLQENLKAQIYFGICEGIASEHSTRMVSMDNATNNAKDMLGKLELLYNRTRQASITKELIEIVSGAESM